ncbi:MAG: enoyl-CoA hydratase family protein [Mycobacteriaceae bacterium]|nr:enoyl-CoA hydratase family protein [Mycobacteriaceae bacterium]
MALVSYATSAAFATITLDSPDTRNAISEALLAELLSALRRAGADETVRAVVLTHSGNTFCAGGALSVRDGENRSPAEISADTTRKLVELLRAMLELPKPIVARVDGHVRAGGMGIVAACDLAVAGPDSTFALTEAKLGVAPAIISLVLLPKLAPRAASRYFLTGEKFGAEQAERIGVVTAAAADPAALVMTLLTEFGKAAPQGLAETKRLLTRDMLAAIDAHADELARRSAALFDTDAAREGILSFLGRREPSWTVIP